MSDCPAIPLRRRRLFPADLHPGSPAGCADRDLDVLRHDAAGEIVLAGDSLDLCHPPFPQWRAAHDEVLVRRAQKGRRIVCLTGTHDRAMRACLGETSGRITVTDEAMHGAADDRRHLVVHGDGADGRILRGHILTRPGSRLDRPLRHPDERLHRQRPPLLPADRRIPPTPPVRGPNLSTSERLPHA